MPLRATAVARTHPSTSAVEKERALDLVRSTCRLAGSLTLIDDLQAADLQGAVAPDGGDTASNDHARLFDWLLTRFNYQGISDRVAAGFMAHHGLPTYAEICTRLDTAACGKLGSHWAFVDCGYQKARRSCSKPMALPSCPLPAHAFRNGRLNQTAFSFALFCRDIAGGDLPAWITSQLNAAKHANLPADDAGRRFLIEPMSHIFGVSSKVLNMAISDLLIATSAGDPYRLAVGAAMIAVDRLVHAFLHRTRIITAFGKPHAYGPACYQPGGCATCLSAIAIEIDARGFNRAFPKQFARFIQHAVWRYCAAGELNVCNANTVRPTPLCRNRSCRMHSKCQQSKAARQIT